ncbi:hypothetical protein L198_05259 [Cryptococcus wingfieldii CBS 7118]|uniref:Uncharacterized protein n=1 Tax=Cryptococcus wingfieldii CBS 7118 TaxID=1295528 RepID=A0A1E3IXQ3_9TREE|nr:hypothetical protein L198_05259 [Cryptococcus wingfieldii CBS 7118]ODN93397.1 hypothetical protein L198_05259 [Cryptococcus wingfieldii CBS 7118]
MGNIISAIAGALNAIISAIASFFMAIFSGIASVLIAIWNFSDHLWMLLWRTKRRSQDHIEGVGHKIRRGNSSITLSHASKS